MFFKKSKSMIQIFSLVLSRLFGDTWGQPGFKPAGDLIRGASSSILRTQGSQNSAADKLCSGLCKPTAPAVSMYVILW